jgi:PPOX class probable F420-dependent enzyme
MREDSKLEQFQNKEYIRLETVKRNGLVVPTPVWFVVEDGTLFVRSYANSGKVKRMRNNPHVRVTPSDAMGKSHGVTIEGTAIRVNGDMEIKISQQLYRKYGLMKMSFDLWGAIKQLDWAVFAIEI